MFSTQRHADASVIILLGPPGSGKSTQGAKLGAALQVPTLSTGELLRAEVAAGTELGANVRAAIESGGIVDDAVVNAMLSRRLRQNDDCAYGAILDGYPRTVQQAKFLQALLHDMNMGEPIIVEFIIGLEVLVSRLSAREYCPRCGRVYNIHGEKPRTSGRCDEDAAPLLRRADDERPVVEERLANHRRLSTMLEHYFHGRMRRVAAQAPPPEVFDQVMEIVTREMAGRRAAVPSSAA